MNKLIIGAAVIAGLSVSASAAMTNAEIEAKFNSNGNQLKIEDITCDNGEDKFVMEIYNTKSPEKVLSYNACTDAKVNWINADQATQTFDTTGSSTDSSESTEWTAPEGHASGEDFEQIFAIGGYQEGDPTYVQIDYNGNTYIIQIPDTAPDSLQGTMPLITEENNKFSVNEETEEVFYNGVLL